MVAQMEDAFQPQLAVYRSAEQGEFRDRQNVYNVPASLRNIVTGLIGFGQRKVASRKRARIGAGLVPLDPATLERLYKFPQGDGAGQKIAIAELGGGYFVRDLQIFCRKIERAEPKVRTVSVNMPVRSLAQIRKLPKGKQQEEIDNTGEVMMDVEIVAGLCPAAEISVYFATFDQKGWVDLLDRVIKDRPVALSAGARRRIPATGRTPRAMPSTSGCRWQLCLVSRSVSPRAMTAPATSKPTTGLISTFRAPAPSPWPWAARCSCARQAG
jgi:kumamolisin